MVVVSKVPQNLKNKFKKNDDQCIEDVFKQLSTMSTCGPNGEAKLSSFFPNDSVWFFLLQLQQFADKNKKEISNLIPEHLRHSKLRGLDFSTALMLLPVLFRSQVRFSYYYISKFCKNEDSTQAFMSGGFRHSPKQADLLQEIQEMGDQYVASLSSDDKVVIAKLLKAQRLSDEVEYSSSDSSSEESD
jgi:hypothetical protein